MMNVEAAITENAATVAELGAYVASEKASSKKRTSPKKGASKGHKAAKGGKAKASPKKEAESPAAAKDRVTAHCAEFSFRTKSIRKGQYRSIQSSLARERKRQ